MMIKKDYTAEMVREFQRTNKPVNMRAFSNKHNYSYYKMRKLIPAGWVGRRHFGYAPRSYWPKSYLDTLDAKKAAPKVNKRTKANKKSVSIDKFLVERFAEPIPAAKVELILQQELEPEQQSISIIKQEQNLSVDAYYIDIRSVWETLRAALSDAGLEDFHEDIMLFKEETRKHLNEVMKKL